MDPISAAGIGLSVTSLTAQIFSGCIKGRKYSINAKLYFLTDATR